MDDRRTLICRAAIEILADGGLRSLTHHGIDRRLGLALGSTSYYFRTRHALLMATAAWLAEDSRQHLSRALSAPRPAGLPAHDAAARLVSGQLLELLGPRRNQALARAALLGEPGLDQDVRRALAHSLFSVPAAARLFEDLGAPDPAVAAEDLVSFLEGLLQRGLWAEALPSEAEADAAIARHLRQVLGG
ncbi:MULTISPECIES: hypothetical protein [Arthrobacter]|uniref:HTH tetR-type domain-containing protein n=2 Tax=Arthrobacter TaxID=1663 RepID=A0ABU9KGF3_9MICC|nr:hypothetical protein [Arthrobacter sp. YJM1]MDP5225966.1 hypothetical protein [Arthrobacter sp. YJM1]